MWAASAYFDVVGQEGGTGETSAEVASEVDDEDTPRADELLKVTHEDHLDEHRDHQIQNPATPTTHLRLAQTEEKVREVVLVIYPAWRKIAEKRR